MQQQQRNAADVLSVSSNSSICSDFCGFKEFQEIEMSLKQKSKYMRDLQGLGVGERSHSEERGVESRPLNPTNQELAAASTTEAKKRFFVSEMELLPAEEIFEVSSNSTTDTIRRQRLERNKELSLKETFLMSRNPIKKISKGPTFQRMRAEENSESSSEFPASSPSNTQFQKKPQQSQRPPLLKNTLPADAFERGLALIAAQNPPMTVTDKIGSWQCENVDNLSDVDDVKGFDESFRERVTSTKRLPTRAKTAVGGETYTTFAEFYKRISKLRAPEIRLRGNDSKQKSKLTSEDDEKPTTSNCLQRNRDTPLKKRPGKYKRAAEPAPEAQIPKKKSSSSGTPKHETPNVKKKAQQSKSAATGVANDANKVCAESSAASSHAQTKDNSKGSSARCSRPARAKQAKIAEKSAISSNLGKQIGLTTAPSKDNQDAFFRWRRLNREIDKTSALSPQPKPIAGLIQIRYDFIGPDGSNKQEKKSTSSNACNIVVKTLKLEDQKNEEESTQQNVIFKTPLDPKKIKEATINATTTPLQETQIDSTKEKAETKVKDDELEQQKSDCNQITKNIDEHMRSKSSSAFLDYSVEFHQQHEFCNYLGLTGMSTANAMANAAEELSKCNIARRSLRVRKKEIQKAKFTKQKTTPKKMKANELKNLMKIEESVAIVATANAELKEEPLDNLLSETMENVSSTMCAENIEMQPLQQEASDKPTVTEHLTPSEQLMQQTKEREAKIQILCQITASSKKEEEEACKKCVEQITEPIRRTLLEQCKQNGNVEKAALTALETTSASRRLSEKLSTLSQLATLPTPLAAASPSLASKSPQLTKATNIADNTTFIEITPKTPEKFEESVKAEVKTLHEKVQRCLEESRQNIPNIFIVKSLDNLKDNNKIGHHTKTATATTGQQTLKNVEKCGNLMPDEILFSEQDHESFGNELPLKNINRRLKPGVRNNKATQVTDAAKNKKRKARNNTSIRKSNSNMTSTRRLYTRSMLNLNQQRELRNRKVILKLLKTYSGLRIKVSQPKKKASNTAAPATAAGNNGNKKNRNNQAADRETSIELAVSSEDTTVGDKISSPMTTLFLNKISDSSSANAVRDSNSSSVSNDLMSVNEDSVVDTTNDYTEKLSKSCETKAEFEYENFYAGESENLAAASSRTLTPKRCSSAEKLKKPYVKDKLADVAVQTDLANVTTILQPVCLDDMMNAVNLPPPSHLQTNDSHEMDVVSSSDAVTSTTTHIGEQNRPSNAAKPNLVTKELYRNFSFIAESNVAADVAPSQTSTATNLFTEINPLADISLNSSAVNINEMGIHSLSEPSRALRNPLKSSDGRVLYMYYEDGLLIVVQEALISFWKYSRILNALTVKLHDKSVANVCNSRELVTEELQSSAATMDFRSSDLEHMSSMLVSGCEWFYLGERKRLTNDMEIESPYMNRLCFNDSRPLYVEMRCRMLLNDFRECNLLSCYVNVYFFNEEEQVPCFHSIQLDTIQSAPNDVIYTTIFDSRYFVLAWPQANVLGKVRSGICKYALTPELDMLATTRDFKAMRHALRSLECLKDGKLLGFGDSQLTVWDHRSGDVLMNYDLSMPLGRSLGTIYYQGLEDGQDNVVIMLQHVRSEASSDLVVVACTISHTSPSRRVLQRHRLPTPAFYNIKSGVNNGEHFVITAESDEEIWINCNDPRQLIFIPAQRSQRFYSTHRTTLIELTHQTLTVDTFSNYLLKIAAGGRSSGKKKLPRKGAAIIDEDVNNVNKTNWSY